MEPVKISDGAWQRVKRDVTHASLNVELTYSGFYDMKGVDNGLNNAASDFLGNQSEGNLVVLVREFKRSGRDVDVKMSGVFSSVRDILNFYQPEVLK
jgi:hypothetical protein